MASVPRSRPAAWGRLDADEPAPSAASCRRLRESLLARAEGVRLRMSVGLLLADHLRTCPTCAPVASDMEFLRTCVRVAPWLGEHRARTLTPAASTAVTAHLRRCPLCRIEAAALGVPHVPQATTAAAPAPRPAPPAATGGPVAPGPAAGDPGLVSQLRLAGRRTVVATLVFVAVLGGAGVTLLHAPHTVGAPQPASTAPRPPAVSISTSTTATPTAGRPQPAPSAATAASADATRPPGTPGSASTAPPAAPPAAITAPAGPPAPTPRPTPAPSPSPTPAPIIPPLPTPPFH